MYIFVADMDTFLKIVLLFLFTICFANTLNGTPAADSEVERSQVSVSDLNKQELSNAQWPYFPEGELTSEIQSHRVIGSRLQRVSWQGYSFVLKHLVQKMALRQTAVTRHLERIYDTTTSYYCSPVSGYYVFALRRIII